MDSQDVEGMDRRIFPLTVDEDMDTGTYEVHQNLLKLLDEKKEILSVSRAFLYADNDAGAIDVAYDKLKENNLLPILFKDKKNNTKSVSCRTLGNKLYIKKDYLSAIEYYTQSIALAEPESAELAISFANRSAALFENKLYKECLEDIDRAIRNRYPEKLMKKVEIRKANALKLISEQVLIEPFCPPISIPEEDRNELIPCASKSVKIQLVSDGCRGVVATTDIKPGQIICVEDALYSNIICDFYTYCHHCLNLCYNLVPCSLCTVTLYCGEACQKNDEFSHKYLCPILLTLKKLNVDKMDVMALKIAVSVRDKYDKLDQCILGEDGVYRSDRYEEIHNLEGNSKLRATADRFSKATHTAVLYHLVKNYTNFFGEIENLDAEDTFKHLVFHHRQTGPCNFHDVISCKSVGGTKTIGAGAYPVLSMFNHACWPNVTRRGFGRTAVVVAIETIKKGEQCFDNYGYHCAIMPQEDRQAHLLSQYYFQCTCNACKEDYPLFPFFLDLYPEHDLHAVLMERLKRNELTCCYKLEIMIKQIVKKIKKCENKKPNRSLASLQECLKHCYTLADAVQVPF